MKKVITIILSVILLIIFIALVGVFIFYTNMQKPVQTESEVVEIEIQKGETLLDLSRTLLSKNLIRSQLVFKVYIKLNNADNIQAGKYELNKNMSMSEIVSTIEKGPDTSKQTVNITFLEGKNMRWIAKKIAEFTSNTEEDVYTVLSDKKYLNELINKYWFITDDILDENIYYSLEGYLFPDTYNFANKEVSVETIFNAMIEQMQEKLKPYKTKIESSGISVHKLLSLASVVEMEASNEEDRAGVSSVLYNRINKNMSLGSDVTTYYAVKVDMSERELYQSELNKANPYNTRGPNMNGKLPIGPICSVSISSIDAAINPETTNNLYFVADKNGKIYFAETETGHKQNISKLKSQNLWYTYED